MKNRHFVVIGLVLVFLGTAAFTQSFTAWRHSRHIAINRKNDPQLIQLTEKNFDFSEAQSDGRDIRFTDLQGQNLPYCIDNWNRELKTAVIFVKVNHDAPDETFIMYWGNGRAVSAQAAVVDVLGPDRGGAVPQPYEK